VLYTSVGNRHKSVDTITKGRAAEELEFGSRRRKKNFSPLHSVQTVLGAPSEGRSRNGIWWHTETHGWRSEGEKGEWRG